MVDIAIQAALDAVALCDSDGDSNSANQEDPAVAAACRTARRVPMSRHEVLAKARYVKLKKRKAQVAPHVTSKLEHHNTTVAVRQGDLIDIDEVRPRRLSRATRKSGLPHAVLAACFAKREVVRCSSTRAAIRMRRFRGPRPRRKAKRRTDPNVRSVRSVAEAASASTSHIGRLRDAVCNIIHKQQRQYFKTVVQPRRDECGILEVMFDETEIKVSKAIRLPCLKKIKIAVTEAPVMITHGTLFWKGSSPKGIPVVCPAVGMQSKTGQDMLAVVDRSLKEACGSVTDLAATVAIFILIVISDAAKANRLLVRHLRTRAAANTLVLHLMCFMHQVSLSVGNCYTPLKVLGPIFCGTNILRRSTWLSNFMPTLKRYIRSRKGGGLDVVYDSPQSPADFRYATELLDLLEWDEQLFDNDEDLARQSQSKEKRRVARRHLAKFLTGSWLVRHMQHHCSLGCCSDPEQSYDKLAEYVCDLLLLHMPQVPALTDLLSTTGGRCCSIGPPKGHLSSYSTNRPTVSPREHGHLGRKSRPKHEQMKARKLRSRSCSSRGLAASHAIHAMVQEFKCPCGGLLLLHLPQGALSTSGTGGRSCTRAYLGGQSL